MNYPNLWEYQRDLYQAPGFGETPNLFHIEHHALPGEPSSDQPSWHCCHKRKIGLGTRLSIDLQPNT